MSVRKSPEISATKVPIDTIMKGNDGNLWIVKNSGKSQKWFPVNRKAAKLDGENFISINILETQKLLKKKFKKVAKLEIEQNKIGIGELIYNEFPAKKGLYIIYELDGSYLAVPENTDINTLQLKLNNKHVESDIGMTAFLNLKESFPHNETLKKPMRNFKYSLKYFDVDYGRNGNKLYLKHFNFADNKIDSKNIVGVFLANHEGDGSFPIYSNSKTKSYLVINGNFYESLLRLMHY